MNPAMIAGAIRTALAAVSGALVYMGVVDADTAAGASGNVETIIGSLGSLGTLAWSIWAKMNPADK
jgi:hypothetical protein